MSLRGVGTEVGYDVNNGTGKSSMTVQFVDGHFVESYYPTIENTFSKVIKYKGQEYATEIIDTAGQVRTPSSEFSKSHARESAPVFDTWSSIWT